MGRAIREIHGKKPARQIAVGAGPARHFRHDLQPRRRARFGNARQFQGCRRTRQLSVPVECLAAGSHAMEGGVPNGLYIHALARNTGEVFGVFADFAARRVTGPTPLSPALIDYTKNSVKFDGLQTLEEKIAVLRAPPWP